MQRQFCIILTCIMIISMLAGCSALQKLGFNDEVSPVSSIALSEAEAQQIANKVPIYLYFANEEGTKLKLEVRYIPVSEAKKTVNEIASLIVKELISGPKSSGLKATIPAETKLRSTVKIDGEVATVDLSKEFKEKHPGGKAAEQLTIYSIVNSLTELKEISKVKFKIDGKTAKEFKGNFKFDSAFPRSAPLISKEVAPSGTIDNGSSKGKAEEEQKSGDKTKSSDKDSKDTINEENSGSEVDVFQEDEGVNTSEVIEGGDKTTSESIDGGDVETSKTTEGKDQTTFYLQDEQIEEEILE
ncbi:GerMN domain-containing protein [Acetivibrio cellulolyticus]|uniref:GerMN domain-containing protein n=1 Tax=Acetivibrio cellulolyticus TaxID=35830 RepID=UPI0001E2E69D|nr:GerMN domain-containing protein [Acetivibrio cellulolyticus]